MRREVFASLLTVLALAGCGESNTYVPPPPAKVTVAPPVQREVTPYLDATGNSAAVNTTNLVARVSGFVQSINYADGDFVKKGTVLFVIEPETYELKRKQSEAAEAGARATLQQAQAEYERQKELASRGTASKAALDNATANRDSADANLKQAEINTRLAAINVEYTRVTAPFDGVVTARQVSVGEYVGTSPSPAVLATIVELDPIHVNFTVSEQDVLRIRSDMRRRGMTPADLRQVPVEVALQGEASFKHKGTLDYVAPTVDPSTGTLSARALLSNPDRVLLPGFFVRVRVPVGPPASSLLVADAALGNDQAGRYLLVVTKENVVEKRPVELGPLDEGLRVIAKGLKADDRVIVGGLLRAVPGQKVDPQTSPASATSPPPAAK